ncbi:hypothetical protein CDAR_456051 [Caerostris darwini]|uniref:Uncharacterized protein n=1 Tax=Caerostris darwini TaxID=1538125 RepID=A0AAV4RT36_9ARAC|nr:hypothetical protein CDAR_456051 [Caerostris darwini]
MSRITVRPSPGVAVQTISGAGQVRRVSNFFNPRHLPLVGLPQACPDPRLLLVESVSMTTASRRPFRKEAAKRFSPITPSLHKNLQPPWMQAGDAGEAISKTRRGRPVFPRCTHARNKPSAPGTRGIVFMLTEDLFITTAVVRPNVDSKFANPSSIIP